MTADAPRLYTPEQAAEILNGHAAPFSARAGDVTPGGLRAAAHRREIPFRLWRGKVRFTDEDLRGAVTTTAVPAVPAERAPGGITLPPGRRSHSGRPGRVHAASNAASPAEVAGPARRLTAKTVRTGAGRPAGSGSPAHGADRAPCRHPAAGHAARPARGGQ